MWVFAGYGGNLCDLPIRFTFWVLFCKFNRVVIFAIWEALGGSPVDMVCFIFFNELFWVASLYSSLGKFVDEASSFVCRVKSCNRWLQRGTLVTPFHHVAIVLAFQDNHYIVESCYLPLLLMDQGFN